MKNNKDIIIICAIVALCILAINIVLTLIVGLYSFCVCLVILLIISLLFLLWFVTRKNKEKKYLTNIEHTIRLKLEDLQSDSIVPIRNTHTVEIIDDTSIKRDLEQQREKNVTKEVIEEELSKTVFINNLKDKIKLFEKEQEVLRQHEEEQELNELRELIKTRNK